MCGRIVLASNAEELAKFLRATVSKTAKKRQPSYNVGPSSQIYAVTAEEGKRRLDLFRWGLVPFWAKEPSVGSRMFNARAETIAEKPAFRNAFRKRRCLVPVDAFYEWKQEDGKSKKTPFVFFHQREQPLVLAGLDEEWQAPDNSLLRSLTIVTTEANALMREYHQRMPLILTGEKQERWLHLETTNSDEVEELLSPPTDDSLAVCPTDQKVGNVRFDDPSLLRDVDGLRWIYNARKEGVV